ncbi:MAG: hypothetical protein ABI599_05805 [Flavobacteriales bacterium]
MKTSIQRLAPSALAYTLILLLGILSWSVSHAQGQAIIKGSLYSPEEIISPQKVALLGSDGEEVPVQLRFNGHFKLNLPADQVHVLRFSKPGCVTKEVCIDTRSACKKDPTKDRLVKFEVVLHEADGLVAEEYAGVVGRINFHKSNGRMQVQKDYAQRGDLAITQEVAPAK